MYVTHCVRTLFDQSERGYSVRHGVYIHCLTNQSVAIACVQGVRQGVYVRYYYCYLPDWRSVWVVLETEENISPYGTT